MPLRYPKELLPIAFIREAETGVIRPQLSIEFSLRALAAGDIHRAIVLISDSKREIVRVLGDGTDYGVHLAYVPREVPLGLADAITAALPWVGESHVALSLPDTVFQPADAFNRLRERLLGTAMDLVLGVFPTGNPRTLGPVQIGAASRVLRVWEKPREPTPNNTWGIAVWSLRFTQFLKAFMSRNGTPMDLSVGHAFQGAVESGLRVSAIDFIDGSYLDIGTLDGIQSLVSGAENSHPCDIMRS